MNDTVKLNMEVDPSAPFWRSFTPAYGHLHATKRYGRDMKLGFSLGQRWLPSFLKGDSCAREVNISYMHVSLTVPNTKSRSKVFGQLM